MQGKITMISCALSQCLETEPNDTIVALAANGLQLLSAHCSEIYETCSVSRDFLTEIIQITDSVSERAVHAQQGAHAAKEKYLDALFLGDPQAVAFQLFECLAVVLREAKARKILEKSGPHEDIFAYFESSGEWSPSDGTPLTNCYFNSLSGSVCEVKQHAE